MTCTLPAATGSSPVAPAEIPASLDPLLRSYPETIVLALRGLRDGVRHYQAGAYEATLASLPRTESAATTAVPDVILLYAAKSSLALDRPDVALQGFRLLIYRHPDSPRIREAILGEAQALLRLRDPAGAIAALAHPAAGDGAEVLYFRARGYEDEGNRSEAVALYRKVYASLALAERAEAAGERLLALAPGFLADSRNHATVLERARNLIRGGRNSDARKLLTRVRGLAVPDRASAEQRTLLLGETEYNLGRARAALQLFRKVGTSDAGRHAQALYWIGASLRRLGNVPAFLAVRDEAVRLYPQAPATEELLYAVATHLDVECDAAGARAAYRRLVANFPRGQHARRARWKLAQYDYARADYAEALRGFGDSLLSAPEPNGASETLFWLGRCSEKMGNPARAAHLYGRAQALSPNGYYGLCAREAAARLGPQPAPAPTPGFDFAPVDRLVGEFELASPRLSPPSPAAAAAIERARQLAVAELPDLAVAELRAALEGFPDVPVLSFVMARVYELKGDFYGVISTLRRAFPRYVDYRYAELPAPIWQLLFPVRHRDLIESQAAKYGIPPALVLGLIRQESAFLETARSRANARGLMQVLPGTGRGLARTLGESRYTTQKLFRPETNIAFGLHHLHTLLERYAGKVELALAAYNAGASRVDRWMKEFGDDDTVRFVEQIPFAETRAYVKQVLANQAHYRRLTAGETGPGQ